MGYVHRGSDRRDPTDYDRDNDSGFSRGFSLRSGWDATTAKRDQRGEFDCHHSSDRTTEVPELLGKRHRAPFSRPPERNDRRIRRTGPAAARRPKRFPGPVARADTQTKSDERDQQQKRADTKLGARGWGARPRSSPGIARGASRHRSDGHRAAQCFTSNDHMFALGAGGGRHVRLLHISISLRRDGMRAWIINQGGGRVHHSPVIRAPPDSYGRIDRERAVFVKNIWWLPAYWRDRLDSYNGRNSE